LPDAKNGQACKVKTLAGDRHRHGDGPGHRLVGAMVAVCLLLLAPGLAIDRSFGADHTVPVLQAWQRAHEGHLTVEWATPVRVQQKRIDDRLILRFADPLGVDVGPALRNLSTLIDVDRSRAEGSELTLVLKPGVSSYVSLGERRIVAVDLVRDPTVAPLARIQASTIDNGVRLMLSWPGPTQVDGDQQAGGLRLSIAPGWDIDAGDLAGLQETLRPWLERIDVEDGALGKMLSIALQPQIASSVQPAGPAKTFVDLTRQAATPPVQSGTPQMHVFLPAKRPQAGPTDDAVRQAGPPMPARRPEPTPEPAEIAAAAHAPSAADQDLPEAIVIDWRKPVGAAVFLRAGHLWAVFDEADAGLLAVLPKAPAAFGSGSFVPAEGGTALRYPLRADVAISVSREDGQWRIEPAASPAQPKAVSIERVDASSALRLAPAAGGHVVRLVDPDIGDRIDVLPLGEAGIGLPRRQRFVDLDLLPTVQGLAWRPLNDRLTASVDDQGLEFRTPEGLALSSLSHGPSASDPVFLEAMATKATEHAADHEGVDERSRDEPAEQAPARPVDVIGPAPASYVNLAGSGVERELVNEYRRIRRQAIGKAAPEKRDQARLDLARLLVSERLATEARTVLSSISDGAASEVVLQKQALSGVAAFLLGHRAEASSILLDANLDDDREIEIWRAALDSMDAKWQAAAERWRRGDGVLDAYPPRLKLDLGLMALKTAIETNDDGMMRRGLRRLSSLALNPHEQARFDAVKALKAERSGDLETARSLLTGLTESPDHAMRTQAKFELAALDLDTGAPDPDALAEVERDMVLWRGHPDERAILDRLARRYVDAHALRRALMVWRRLIHLFPDAAADQELKRTRQNAFVRALTNDVEPALDPLDIYATYLDFIDLLPGDPEARVVLRHLAGNLAELDLLDEAIDVLRSLVTSAGDDLERAEIAAEIATLMLLQDRAAPALAMLEATAAPNAGMSAELAERRQLIGARALAKLERPDDALRAIQDLTSPSARRLRAEILWQQRRWPHLAAAVESYFAAADPAAPLSAEDQELVLWLALAHAQENDAARLSALRARFGSAMQGGDHAEPFEVATQGAIETRDIKGYLAATGDQIAELQRFRAASPP
jgi:hypothetical protein